MDEELLLDSISTLVEEDHPFSKTSFATLDEILTRPDILSRITLPSEKYCTAFMKFRLQREPSEEKRLDLMKEWPGNFIGPISLTSDFLTSKNAYLIVNLHADKIFTELRKNHELVLDQVKEFLQSLTVDGTAISS